MDIAYYVLGESGRMRDELSAGFCILKEEKMVVDDGIISLHRSIGSDGNSGIK